MYKDIKTVEKEIAVVLPELKLIKDEVSKVIVGQSETIDSILMGLLSGGHILFEGMPGLAKTKLITTLAKIIQADSSRIQFTPDLLPADLIGTNVYNPKTGDFIPKKGPLFSNLIIADEVNRAPAKVQSALLEVMQEKQITFGGKTYLLDFPFLVMATQNPIEQEGTYALPEAQLDRFMLKVLIDYPNEDDEIEIINKVNSFDEELVVEQLLDKAALLNIKKLCEKVYIDDKIKKYIVQIVQATRPDDPHSTANEGKKYIQVGASPRASISFVIASRIQAFLQGRGYVIPQDIKDVAHRILQHRILISYEAEAEDLTTGKIIDIVLDAIAVP